MKIKTLNLKSVKKTIAIKHHHRRRIPPMEKVNHSSMKIIKAQNYDIELQNWIRPNYSKTNLINKLIVNISKYHL